MPMRNAVNKMVGRRMKGRPLGSTKAIGTGVQRHEGPMNPALEGLKHSSQAPMRAMGAGGARSQALQQKRRGVTPPRPTIQPTGGFDMPYGGAPFQSLPGGQFSQAPYMPILGPGGFQSQPPRLFNPFRMGGGFGGYGGWYGG
jgi:hypothetical protein